MGRQPEMNSVRRSLWRSVARGALAGAATAAVVAWRGVREASGAAAPINATSHGLWGDEAGAVDGVDAKHTATGLLLNVGAGVFWAFVQELSLARLRPRSRTAAAATGAAVAGLAYVVDYHLLPRRLSPGWELRVSQRSVGYGFVALGATLALAALLAGSPRAPRR
jgi:hypothetical protein